MSRGLNGQRGQALWWDVQQQVWEVLLPSRKARAVQPWLQLAASLGVSGLAVLGAVCFFVLPCHCFGASSAFA